MLIAAHLASAAMAAAPFCGVDVDSLMDTPNLRRDTVAELSAAELVVKAENASKGERDGEPVAVAGTGFSLDFALELPAGYVSVSVDALAPSRGSDSFYVALDGERIGDLLVPSVAAMQPVRVGLDVAEAGRHTVRLTLREGPGCAIRRFAVETLRVRVPQAPMVPELAARHPRLFITAADVPELRRRMGTEQGMRFYRLPDALKRGPPAYRPGKRNGGAFRSLGDSALACLLHPDAERLAAIVRWLEASTAYGDVGADLDAEYFMQGVAICYDWLHADLPDGLRARVRETIADKCRRIYRASLAGKNGGGHSYQQNHYWFAHFALAIGAAAVFGEVPEAEQWLSWAWDRFERIALSFSPDGGFHEGPSYWDFSMPVLTMFVDLYEQCTGLRIPAGDDGLAGQGRFRFYHLFPGLRASAPLEDSSKTGSGPIPDLLLWEAKRYQDKVTMGLAALRAGTPSSRCTNLLYLDERLPAEDPLPALPRAVYYSDIETVFARTDWTPEATFAAFVCRPLGGHRYAELCARFGLSGTGHNHPEQNHFVLFGAGEVLACDVGYTYEKQTSNHNTVLVDGKGQYGDGEMWPRPNPGRARILGYAHDRGMSIVTGDASSAYPPDVGLTRFERTFVLASRELVVVYDRVAASSPRTFGWLLHHWGAVAEEEGGWSIIRNRAKLSVRAFSPEQLRASTDTVTPRYTHPTRDLTPKEAEVNVLTLEHGPVNEAAFLVALVVGRADTPTAGVSRLRGEEVDGVASGDAAVVFSRAPGATDVHLPWGETCVVAPGATALRRGPEGAVRLHCRASGE